MCNQHLRFSPREKKKKTPKTSNPLKIKLAFCHSTTQKQTRHYNITEKQRLNFHSEEMSSLPVLFPVAGYMGLVRMMPPRQRAWRRVGRKMAKEAQAKYHEKGNNLTAKQFTFQRQHKGKMLCAKRKLVSKVYAFYKEPS